MQLPCLYIVLLVMYGGVRGFVNYYLTLVYYGVKGTCVASFMVRCRGSLQDPVLMEGGVTVPPSIFMSPFFLFTQAGTSYLEGGVKLIT